MRKSLVEKRFFTSFRMTMSRLYRDCQLVPLVSLKGIKGMLLDAGLRCLRTFLWNRQSRWLSDELGRFESAYMRRAPVVRPSKLIRISNPAHWRKT